MKRINDYRKRFYNLMESTIGDVKPLISEQAERPVPTPTPNPGNANRPLPEPVTPTRPSLPPMPEPELPSSDKGYLGTALSVHKVASGENLTSIAKTYGVTVDQILKSNPQIKDKNMIKVGEIINIER